MPRDLERPLLPQEPAERRFETAWAGPEIVDGRVPKKGRGDRNLAHECCQRSDKPPLAAQDGRRSGACRRKLGAGHARPFGQGLLCRDERRDRRRPRPRPRRARRRKEPPGLTGNLMIEPGERRLAAAGPRPASCLLPRASCRPRRPACSWNRPKGGHRPTPSSFRQPPGKRRSPAAATTSRYLRQPRRRRDLSQSGGHGACRCRHNRKHPRDTLSKGAATVRLQP